MSSKIKRSSSSTNYRIKRQLLSVRGVHRQARRSKEGWGKNPLKMRQCDDKKVSQFSSPFLFPPLFCSVFWSDACFCERKIHICIIFISVSPSHMYVYINKKAMHKFHILSRSRWWPNGNTRGRKNFPLNLTFFSLSLSALKTSSFFMA